MSAADAGDAAFDGGIDVRGLALDLDVGALHAQALGEREPQTHRQDHRKRERELPLQRKEHDERTEDRERADHDVLRPVVRKLRHLEEVGGDAAHQHAGAIFVIKAAG